MRLAGRMFKSGSFWAVDVPLLGVTTQGHTKNEAYVMIADAIEELVGKRGFSINVYPGPSGYFEIGSLDLPALIAFFLRRQRKKSGLTLEEAARRLGASSINAYARYEQGRSVPTVEKFRQLLAAISPDADFVLLESQVQSIKKREF